MGVLVNGSLLVLGTIVAIFGISFFVREKEMGSLRVSSYRGGRAYDEHALLYQQLSFLRKGRKVRDIAPSQGTS